MSPLPTRPIDDAGPLKGKTPPILISVAEIPGSSVANAGPLRSKARAIAIFHFTDIVRPPKRAPTVARCCFVARPLLARLPARFTAATGTRSCHRSSRPYRSFLELVKHLDARPATSEQPDCSSYAAGSSYGIAATPYRKGNSSRGGREARLHARRP